MCEDLKDFLSAAARTNLIVDDEKMDGEKKEKKNMQIIHTRRHGAVRECTSETDTE